MSSSHLDALSRIAPILGESAIIDKETGQVFWQGGKQSLFDSTVGHSYISSQQEGVLQHMRATLLSCILWISFIRYISEWALKQNIFMDKLSEIIHPSQKILNVLRILTRAMLFCLACLPKFKLEVLMITVMLYFLEAYNCSTRKYLINAISCPGEVETFMEGLCEEEPEVTWKIRCYHYEKRKWLRVLLFIDVWNYLSCQLAKITTASNTAKTTTTTTTEYDDTASDVAPPQELLGKSFLTRKVITHQSKRKYKVAHWHDDTISGIWKQAQAATTVLAAFTKISVYKLLLFENKQARIDYFKQQSHFIGGEATKDDFAEFSTHVDVKGYRAKVLAVRSTTTVTQKFFNIHYFWLFTMIGLTVPYRIHFGKHCDELRVAVVKEVSSRMKVENDSLATTKPSWFASPRSWLWGPATAQDLIKQRKNNFRLKMQEMSLYKSTGKEVLVHGDISDNSLANPLTSEKNDNANTTSTDNTLIEGPNTQPSDEIVDTEQ